MFVKRYIIEVIWVSCLLNKTTCPDSKLRSSNTPTKSNRTPCLTSKEKCCRIYIYITFRSKQTTTVLNQTNIKKMPSKNTLLTYIFKSSNYNWKPVTFKTTAVVSGSWENNTESSCNGTITIDNNTVSSYGSA